MPRIRDAITDGIRARGESDRTPNRLAMAIALQCAMSLDKPIYVRGEGRGVTLGATLGDDHSPTTRSST